MSLENWMLEHYGNENAHLGLERLYLYFEKFKKSFSSKKIITVAGTNGKGETCLVLENLLKNYGVKTALWTSPHIERLSERFRFNSKEVSEEKLSSTMQRLGKLPLSYYEFLFLVFCELCEQNQPDVIILEVGLGGRLDAVNFFDADISAVTSISRDHQAILGNRFSKILFEKLGISRAHKKLITSLGLKYLRSLTVQYCQERKIPQEDLFEIGLLSKEDSFSTCNRMTALAIFQTYLSKPLNSIDPYLLKSIPQSFNARREKWSLGAKQIEFIGAHNLDGFRKVLELLSKNYQVDRKKYDTILLSFSKRPMDDVVACIKCLETKPWLYSTLVLTSFDHPKAFEWNELKEHPSLGNVRMDKIQDFKNYFKDHERSERLLVLGSYYFIGELKSFLRGQRRSIQI